MKTYYVFSTEGGRTAILDVMFLPSGETKEIFHVFSDEGEYVKTNTLFFEPELEGEVLGEDYPIPSLNCLVYDGSGHYEVINGAAKSYTYHEYFGATEVFWQKDLATDKTVEIPSEEGWALYK